MPVWSWQDSFSHAHSPDSRDGAMSSGLSWRTRLWNTLSCAHISVEISGRRVRAFSRAWKIEEAIEFGLPRSST